MNSLDILITLSPNSDIIKFLLVISVLIQSLRLPKVNSLDILITLSPNSDIIKFVLVISVHIQSLRLPKVNSLDILIALSPNTAVIIIKFLLVIYKCLFNPRRSPKVNYLDFLITSPQCFYKKSMGTSRRICSLISGVRELKFSARIAAGLQVWYLSKL